MKRIKIVGVWMAALAVGGAAMAAASYADVPDSEGFGSLPATPFSTPAPAPPVSAGGLVAKELAVLTDQGIPPARAEEALNVQSKVAQADLPGALQVAMGGAYAGVWFDNSAARLYVGAASPADGRTAEGVVAAAGLSDHVTIAPVRSTMAQLLAAQERWNRKLANLFARELVATAIEPQRNAVSVTLSSSVRALERAALEREAAASEVNVFITVAASPTVGLTQDAKECNNFEKENANCEPSITAGVEIWSKIKCAKVANQVGARFFKTQKECEEKKVAGGEGEWERLKKAGENPVECTGGPQAIPVAAKKERVLLTAGHCIEGGGELGIEWFASKRNLEEPLIGKAIAFKNGGAEGAKIGDFGDIKIEAGGGWQTGIAATPVLAVTAEWGRAEETRYKVKGERVPAAKNMDCHEGAVSGEKCGEVTALNVKITAEGKTAEGLVEDTAARAGGDSGGPWLFVPTEGNPNHEAMMEGTHVGVKGSTGNSVFEPLKQPVAGAAKGSLEVLELELLTTANEEIKEEKETEKGGGGGGGSGVWEQCSEGGSATKYAEHQCVKAEGSGKWAWKENTSTEEVRIKGSLKLTDTKVPIVGKVSVECSGETTGSVGPGKYGRITKVETSAAQCRKIENCEEIKEIEARNLPWQTEIFSTEGKVVQKLTGTGSGEPGWKITCKVLGITESDECLTESEKPESILLENKLTGSTELLVLATFQHARKAKCSVGGAGAGETSGSVAILKANGWGLRVS
jgi:hypothetical protein